MTIHPLVGAFYRPPAKAILQVLPTGCPLLLVPEPTNEFDPNAIRVEVESCHIPSGEPLEVALDSQGFTPSEIFLQTRWHLGDIPRAAAVVVAGRLNSRPTVAQLCFSAEGKPQVRFAEGLEE